MSSSVAKKLGLKNGYRAVVLNQPEGYQDTLASEAQDVQFEEDASTGDFDFVQLFVRDSDELISWIQTAMDAVKRDGLLWICYPKKSSKIKSDLHRDILFAKVEPYGYTGVSLISVDDTWSAMRFRLAELVKSTRKS